MKSVSNLRLHARAILSVFGIVLFITGCYLALLTASPQIISRKQLPPIKEQEVAQDNQLIIPKLNVKLPINAGSAEVLEKGIWHRFAERGNPLDGGNFILSGHRFAMGLTPWHTLKSSPLYDIDKLAIGDELYVDWQGKRYTYRITRQYAVKPNQVSIEAPSSTAKMTLYTCTKSGAADGREVIEARRVDL